jgi:hypothetical protein
VVWIGGMAWAAPPVAARSLIRPLEEDLFR